MSNDITKLPFGEYKKADVLHKLAFWANLKKGQTLPPDWPNMNAWDDHVREVTAEAFHEITFLRSLTGPVSNQPRAYEEFKRKSKLP